MSASAPFSADHNSPALHRWLIVVTVMLVAILEILDSTIVNVALPEMQAALGADTDQITWVLTSYIVASAIMIPLTGFLTDRLGIRRLLLINITGFLISSILCGTSTSLLQIVIIRTLQGAFGAALIPLSQSVLRQTFPPEQQGKAMAIWGIGIMAAPVLGPTLGGYITSHSTWRWIFYINVPFCLISLSLASVYIQQTKTILRKIAYPELIMMIIGISCLQLFLDQGNSYGWFDSGYITLLSVIAAIGLISFMYISFTSKKPLVKLRLFADRNLAIATTTLALFASAVFAMLALQPIMLESLFGYTPMQVGYVMAPRGFSSAFAMMICGFLMQRIDARILMIVGMSVSTTAAFILSSATLDTGFDFFMLQGLLQGFGMGLIMVPLSYYALSTMSSANVTEGAGLFSYGRQLGTSIGISVFVTLFTHEAQVSWNSLSGSITPYRAQVQSWLAKQGYAMHSVTGTQALTNEVAKQSSMMGFIDSYHTMAIMLLCLIPLLFFLKKSNKDPSDTPAGH